MAISSKKQITQDNITVINNMSAFADAVRTPGTEVTELQRSPEEVERLRDLFLSHAKLTGSHIQCEMGKDGAIRVNFGPQGDPKTQDNSEVRNELTQMAQTYHEMTGIEKFVIEVGKIRSLPAHPHPHPTLNTIFNDKGTSFGLSEGTKHTAEEGSLTFFKDNVMHESTSTHDDRRISVVVYPQPGTYNPKPASPEDGLQ